MNFPNFGTYFGNASKRLVKSPKLYFSDVGLLAFLLGMDARSIPATPLAGALWESVVFAELRETLSARGARGEVYFFRTHEGTEIDFVVPAGRQLDLVECKWTELPSPREAEALEAAAVKLITDGAVSVRKRTIACRTAQPFPITKSTWAAPGLALGDRFG